MAGAITSGMDIAQVRQLATEMQRAAEEIRQIGTRVTARVEATPWLGPDRQRFEQDWRGRQVQQLNAVAQALTEGAQVATKNATEQEQASNQ
jgi:hypothetical protein